MSNMTWEYDDRSGRYLVRGARILFPNFEGAEQDYNQQGKRNFRLELDEDLANELRGRGVFVREREGRDDTEERQYLMKVGVYRDADVRLLSDRNMTALPLERFGMVDREYSKGHVINGDIDLEFHISRNTQIASSSPYVRLDTIIIPIRKSRLLSQYEDYEQDEMD